MMLNLFKNIIHHYFVKYIIEKIGKKMIHSSSMNITIGFKPVKHYTISE